MIGHLILQTPSKVNNGNNSKNLKISKNEIF